MSKSNSAMVFKRSPWVVNEMDIQAWIASTFWQLFSSLGSVATPQNPPQLQSTPVEQVSEIGRQVLFSHDLEAFARAEFGSLADTIFGAGFTTALDESISRQELYEQELSWLLNARVQSPFMVVGGCSMRRLYSQLYSTEANPRIVKRLDLWAPTLAAREELISVLSEAGYFRADERSKEWNFGESVGIVLVKNTLGIPHTIWIRSSMWTPTKNWTADLERSIWDRAYETKSSFRLQLGVTDLFIMATRSFTIDTLCGGASHLMDLVLMLEREGEAIDWPRVRESLNVLTKPDWFWAAITALSFASGRTGKIFSFPDWIKSSLECEPDSYWMPFVESRMNWGNPDARLGEYSRAYGRLMRL